jgi:hypothetical protein
MTCGIYAITYEGFPDRIYIGKSSDIEGRFAKHCRDLKNGTHHNTEMQSLFYSTKSLPTQSIVEITSLVDLAAREIEYIAEFDSFYNGMNGTSGGEGAGPGELSPVSKYSNEDIEEVFHYLVYYPKMSQKEISEITGIPTGTINKISSGVSHTWLAEKFPVEYKALKAMVGKRLTLKVEKRYPDVKDALGNVYQVNAVRPFAKVHKLDPGALSSVLSGKRKTVQGFTLA